MGAGEWQWPDGMPESEMPAAHCLDLLTLFRHVRRDESTGCWIWIGTCPDGKYGSMGSRTQGRPIMAHRFAYTALVGAIEPPLQLDHLCRNTRCVNPDHLQPVTARENIRRGFGRGGNNARKTACERGHLFDDKNTWYSERTGRRQCRACTRERIAERRAVIRSENGNVRAPHPNSLKTHCTSGHPYSGDNLKFTREGERYCAECRRQRARASAQSKRAQLA